MDQSLSSNHVNMNFSNPNDFTGCIFDQLHFLQSKSQFQENCIPQQQDQLIQQQPQDQLTQQQPQDQFTQQQPQYPQQHLILPEQQQLQLQQDYSVLLQPPQKEYQEQHLVTLQPQQDQLELQQQQDQQQLQQQVQQLQQQDQQLQQEYQQVQQQQVQQLQQEYQQVQQQQVQQQPQQEYQQEHPLSLEKDQHQVQVHTQFQQFQPQEILIKNPNTTSPHLCQQRTSDFFTISETFQMLAPADNMEGFQLESMQEACIEHTLFDFSSSQLPALHQDFHKKEQEHYATESDLKLDNSFRDNSSSLLISCPLSKVKTPKSRKSKEFNPLIPNIKKHKTKEKDKTTSVAPKEKKRKPKEQDEKKNCDRFCSKCFRSSTPLWRKSPLDGTIVCNACGILLKKLVGSSNIKLPDAPKRVCSNCLTPNTPIWRRGANKQVLCNACGLYFKHHSESRPLSEALANNGVVTENKV